MTDDPDELQYEYAVARKDPAVAIAAVEEIETQVRHAIPSLKLIGWVIAGLLALILWRIW